MKNSSKKFLTALALVMTLGISYPLLKLSVAPSESSRLLIPVRGDMERFNFAYDQIDDLLSPQETAEFQKAAESFRQKKDDGNFSKFYVLYVDDPHGGFDFAIYGQRASSPLVRARYNKSAEDKDSPDYDSRAHLKKYYRPGDILEIVKTGDRAFKVIAVNDNPV